MPVATPNEWGLAWVPAEPLSERLGRGLRGAVTRLTLRWFISQYALLWDSRGHADPTLTMTPRCSAHRALVVTCQYPALALPTTSFVCARRVHPGEAAQCTLGRYHHQHTEMAS